MDKNALNARIDGMPIEQLRELAKSALGLIRDSGAVTWTKPETQKEAWAWHDAAVALLKKWGLW